MESSWTSSVHAAPSEASRRSQTAAGSSQEDGAEPDVEQLERLEDVGQQEGEQQRGSEEEPGSEEEQPLQGGTPRRPRGLLAALGAAVARLKRKVCVLYFAARDSQLPWTSKMFASVAVAYALSPIDLIPDAIPVIGMLDDLIILPGLIWLAVKFVPPSVMERAEYAADHTPICLQDNWKAALVVLLLWDVSALLVVYFICTRWGGNWLRQNWLALAGPVAAALFVGEALFVSYKLREREAQARTGRASNLAAAEELLCSREWERTAKPECMH